MNDQFQLMKFIRSRTIASLDATPEELAMTIPEGFNNHLLWHYGHIFWVQEMLLHSFVQEEHTVPPHYTELFRKGSSPMEWTIEPPSLSEIRIHLEAQTQRIIEKFFGSFRGNRGKAVYVRS